MLRVGLTGGIASGKSVVREHWACLGLVTVDADRLVHTLFAADGSLPSVIARNFGEHVLADDGSVDRKRLGSVIFGDEAARSRLNAIVHPAVWEAIGVFFSRTRSRGHAIAVVDAALMMETGSYRNYDRVVLVACPQELQLARLLERSKRSGFEMSEEAALARIDSQWPVERKRLLAHYVIDSSDDLSDTLARADDVYARLQEDATRFD